MSGLQHGERATVNVDGEEVTVFDHLSLTVEHYVNSVNGHETFVGHIGKGDSSLGEKPEAVTQRVARHVQDEFQIDVTDHGIRVVDMSRDDVTEP